MAGQEGNYQRRLFPLIRFAVIAPLAILLLVVFQETGTLQGPRGADAAFSGDFNCDATVNTEDVIAVLAVSGGIQPLSSCANAVSVDCDSDTDVSDALLLLHYLSASSVSLPAGCSDINALIPGTSPQSAADQLSARIAGGGDHMDVVQAVQESLARGVSLQATPTEQRTLKQSSQLLSRLPFRSKF